MVAIVGTYQNGFVKLDKEYASNNPVKVIVNFLEDVDNQSKERLSLSDFSFFKKPKKLRKLHWFF